MNEKNYPGMFIRKRREMLGLKQKQLICKGMNQSTLSAIENGTRDINYKQASLIAAKFTELDCPTTADMIMGVVTVNDINYLIEKFLLNPKDNVKKIDDILEYVSEREAIEIIFKIVEKMKKYMYKPKYLDYALKYLMVMTKYSLNHDQYIKRNTYLIFIYRALNDYPKVVITYSNIKNENMELDYRLRNMLNVAEAYFCQEDYQESIKLITELKKLDYSRYEIQTLNLEANILLNIRKYNDSLKINMLILEKALKINSYNYIANSKSNIAYIYMQLNLLEEASKYLKEASDLIKHIDTHYKSNVIDNMFYYEIKCNSPTFETFKNVIKLMVKSNGDKRIDTNIKYFVEYFIKNNKDMNDFERLLKILNSFNISMSSDIKLKIIQYLMENFQVEEKKEFLFKIIEQ